MSSDGDSTQTKATLNELHEIEIDIETCAINEPPDEPYLTVVCISDTHTKLFKIKHVPFGDVLIHAGDFTNTGAKQEIEHFNQQIGALPHKHKLVICGNHEVGLDDSDRWTPYGKGTPKGYELLTNVTYLQDSGVEIEGIKFFGTPWCELDIWGFYKTPEERREIFGQIPSDTDILITHIPPLGIMDGNAFGCLELLNAVKKRIKPKYHVFGHCHESFGVMSDGTTTYINASQEKDPRGIDVKFHQPIVFYIPIPHKTS